MTAPTSRRGPRRNVLAAGVFLDDVDADNGCTMVIPGSHSGPVYDHHTDGLFVGGMDVVAGAAAGCDFASAAGICGPAGTVSVHHVRAVHGSDHNRSRRPRRLLFIECVAADAWPLLGARSIPSILGRHALPLVWRR